MPSPSSDGSAVDGDRDRPRMRSMTMFPKIDALPGTQRQAPVRDGYRQRGLGQYAANVRGHIVGTFLGVPVERIPVRDASDHVGLEIGKNGRICILADNQGRTGVVDEYMREAAINARLSNTRIQLMRYVVDASARVG